MSESENKFEYLPVDSLSASSFNPQEQDDQTFDELVEDIKEVGFIDPIQVIPLEDGTYRILGGAHRWMAAKRAGLEKIPAYILTSERWKDEDAVKFHTVKLNILKGKLNSEKFLSLYNEMVAKYGRESVRKLFGFVNQKEFNKLVDNIKKGMKKSLPKDLQDEFEQASKDVQTVEDLTRIIQTLMAKHGDSLNLDYMVFTYGKKEHVYVAMNSATSKAVGIITKYCKLTGTNINDLVGPALAKLAESYEKEVAGKKSKAKPVKDVGPEF